MKCISYEEFEEFEEFDKYLLYQSAILDSTICRKRILSAEEQHLHDLKVYTDFYKDILTRLYCKWEDGVLDDDIYFYIKYGWDD